MPPNTSAYKAQQVVDLIWKKALDNAEVFLFGDRDQKSFTLTVDEHDGDTPVKHLPDRPHLRLIARLWQENQQLVLAKSRQMMVSWVCMALIVWEIMHPGRQWAVTCKKFEDADALLERAWRIIENIPKAFKPKVVRKQGVIRVEHPEAPSQVLALAQDSDAPRSRTFTGILIDEAAFTDNLEELYTAAKPTVMAGGKVILVSSPNGRGYMYELLTDSGRLEF